MRFRILPFSPSFNDETRVFSYSKYASITIEHERPKAK